MEKQEGSTSRKNDTRTPASAMPCASIQLAGSRENFPHSTGEKMDQQKELNAQFEELQAQIMKAKVDAKARMAILHEQLEAEKAKQADELEQALR